MNLARLTFVSEGQTVSYINTSDIPRIGEKVAINQDYYEVIDVVYTYSNRETMTGYDTSVMIFLKKV